MSKTDAVIVAAGHWSAIDRCLIPAAVPSIVLDPWLITSALRYHQWRMLLPVRTLATQTFRRAPLTWFKPLVGSCTA